MDHADIFGLEVDFFSPVATHGYVCSRFCQEKRIRLDLASVAHPQSNGQVERSNALVLSGIKPRLIVPLLRARGCWLDEIPAVLWSLRTTPNRSTGYTPFFLVYGAELVLPTDIEHDSLRVALYTDSNRSNTPKNLLLKATVFEHGMTYHHS